MSNLVLDVNNLQTHFFTRDGVVKAVEDVSFSLFAGEIIGLVGESGSGKTVTGFSLLGLVDEPGRIVGGSVKLGGVELVGMKQNMLRTIRGKRIAMVFQDPMMTLNPILSIFTQMYLALNAHEKVSRKAARSRAENVLNRVGIPDSASRLDDYPHQFSGGMRQRVAIAIALLHNAEVIVADEPTTALDVSIQAQILYEIKELVAESGTSLVWISHDLATVSSLADHLLVMYAGRVVEEGPVTTVLRNPRHPYTQGLMNSMPATAKPGKELLQIPGSTPSLLNLPEGCAFSSRCSFATPKCQTSLQTSSEGNRSWRCHHPLEAKS